MTTLSKSDRSTPARPDNSPLASQATESYYERHIFFCVNQRPGGESCCADLHAKAAYDHCKSRVKAGRLNGAGKVRVNQAGCLDRCAGGPIVVVYPEAVWYTYVDNHDIDEIVDSHLMRGEIVQRLLTPSQVGC